MKNSLFNFKDDEEGEMFFIAIPVIIFFALLGYWLTGSDATTDPIAVATVTTASDLDADGVPDSEDRCVNRAGQISNGGCPAKISYAEKDNDLDGIRNGIDSCPESKGDASNNGCAPRSNSSRNSLTNKTALNATAPIALTTLDGGSVAVTGNTEKCFAASRNADGSCPADTDLDGVADNEDNCPDMAGPDLGCPADQDGDGIFDNDDACPNAAGSAIDNGCPADSDGDGVANLDDPCPTTSGDSNGCPTDQDNDGVADSIDRCPEQPGTVASNGCPEDGDGDGITDAEDRCPAIPGDINNDGCPADTDGDGVADTADECPSDTGDSANNGCPAGAGADSNAGAGAGAVADDTATTAATTDSDGDSVPDAIDMCPTIAGVIDEKGCPKDSDGDSIADEDDLCPDTAGPITSRGCPQTSTIALSAQDQKILDSALAQVEFNSNSATLTAKSKNILQSVAGLLTKYPQARLEIRGHTDSSGPAQTNMELSMRRARSTANFIAQQGIEITRLIAYGYGESQPIASNATRAGKRTNRRVEFELKF